MSGQRGQTTQLAILNANETCGGYTRAVEEGRMLECARLLDTDVESERGISDLIGVSGLNK